MLLDIPKLNSFIVVLKHRQKQYIENLGCVIFIHRQIMSKIGFSGAVLYRTADAASFAFPLVKSNYLYNLGDLQGNSEYLIRTVFSFRTHGLRNYELDLLILINLIYWEILRYMELYKTNKDLYQNSVRIRYKFFFYIKE